MYTEACVQLWLHCARLTAGYRQGSAALVQRFYTDSGGFTNTAWQWLCHFHLLLVILEHWQTPPFVLRISSHYLRYTHIEIFSNLHILLPPVMRNYIFFTAEQSKCVWPQAFPKMSIRSNVLISQLCKPFFYQLLIRNLKNLTPILDVKKSKYIQVNNGLFHIILQVSTRGHHRGLPSTT